MPELHECVWHEILSLKLAINFRDLKPGGTLRFEQKLKKLPLTSARGGEDLQSERLGMRISLAFRPASRSLVTLHLLQSCLGFLHFPL